jgi:plastocyanin
MPRVKKADRTEAAPADVLEVIRHEIPETAAGAGAKAIPPPAGDGGGVTWRRMLRGVAITEAAGMAILLVAGMLYGLDFFVPLALGCVLFAGAVAWIPRKTKASVVYSLVVSSLTLLMFGGMFYGWTGFLYPQSWFEMAFATVTVTVPLAGIVAAIATLRGHTGTDSARTTSIVAAAVAGIVVVVGIGGAVVANDATRLPGDVTLSASNFEFEQTTLTAKAGDVAIYFDNQDAFAHNVKIEGYGTSQDAGGRQAIRHVFANVAAGTYKYLCTIHNDMTGTITVT